MDNLINFPTSISDSIRTSFISLLKDTHVSLPGIIRSFDSNTQLASVQPAIKRVFKNGGEIDLPIVTNVPVVFPRAGNFVLTMPVKESDECLLVFSERDIGQWVKSGQVSQPSDFRIHSLSDGIAIIGLSSQPNKIANFNSSGTELRSLDGKYKISIADNGDINIENEGAAIRLLNSGGISITNKVTGVNLVSALQSFALEVAATTITITSGDSAGVYQVDNKAALQGFAAQFADLGG